MTNNDVNSLDVLQSLIEFARPTTILTIGPESSSAAMAANRASVPELSHHHLSSGQTAFDQVSSLRADLAVVTDTLEQLDHSQGVLLLGTLRNIGIGQIAVTVSDDSGWNFADFIGLGFKRHAKFIDAGHSVTLYTYNLASYNHKRDWNNPKNWANPEMWGKAWW